jgi:hypothetical protein
MAFTERENFIRAIEFRGPEWIPVIPYILPAAWIKYREKLEEIVLTHPKIFGPHERGCIDFDGLLTQHQEYYRDEWGCLWHNLEPGILGQVVEHPLADWRTLADLRVPNPARSIEEGGTNWLKVKKNMCLRKEMGQPAEGEGGFIIEILVGLRGFENFMMDIATGSHKFKQLIDVVLKQKMALIGQLLETDVDIIHFHGDIGTQRGPMISPTHFRKYIKPMYKTMFMACRDAGVHVFYSSDGNILELVDDLIECGVSLHDPQFRSNTLEGIVKNYKGRLCARVDLDQQHILPFGTPADVDSHVREVVKAMYSPDGGLMIYTEIQAAYPLRNIETLCEALKKYCLSRIW